MNAHLPQSVEAATELRMIAAVPHQIVSPRESVPIVSVVQDTLVGANRFTRDGVLFTKKEAMNLLINSKRWDGKLPEPATTTPQPMWSGKQLFSTLLPPVSLAMNNSSDQLVKICDGQMLEGILDKSVFSKQLLHIIYNDYGPDVTVDFLDSLQAMIANFLMNSGFSVGISDLIADQATNTEIQAALSKLTKSIEDQILQLHTGLFENSSGRSNQEEFEAKVMATLNKAVDEAGKIGLRSLADINRMTNMIKAGSKGSNVNVSQMVAVLGQQAIEGKRVPNGFQHRTLPHFKRFDDSAQARGFISSSYIKGLQPDEFFFHAMSGREGLIDTAVKTADTGYMQRQIRVALEDLVTQHDGSVRDATGNLLQLSYGEDGINATKLESQPLPVATMSDEQIRAHYAADGALAEQYLRDAFADRDLLVSHVYLFKPQKNVRYPVHLDRMICALKMQMHLADGAGTVTAHEVLETQKTILNRTHAHNRLWQALVRYHLAPIQMVKHGYNSVALAALAEQIVLKHWKAWVEPGQTVGVIAAQSIGEPATQMSSIYSTKIVIHNKNVAYSGPIGAYIDKLLETQKDKVITIGTDSVVLDVETGDAIIGVSTDEKTSWLPIKQVSRHPANGGLVEVRTRTGRITTATLTHSFLTRAPTGIVPTLGSALKVGDRVPIAKKIPIVASPITEIKQGAATYKLNRLFGWLCGIYLADGSFNGRNVRITKLNPKVEGILKQFCESYNYEFTTRLYRGAYGPVKDNNIHSKDLRDFLDTHFKHGGFDKTIPEFAFHAPQEFIAGLIGGYFDGDGNVSVERQHIRVSSRCESLLRDINRLLGYVGLYGYLGKETSIRIPDAVQHTLNIPKSLIQEYAAAIGFELPEKAVALQQIVDYRQRNDNPERSQDMIDKIPALGEIIAETGLLLKMPGQSRTYGRWAKKESIGRETLQSYLPKFEEAYTKVTDSELRTKIGANLTLLQSAAYSDVLWDEIVELVYHTDPHTFVYDFTVPGNDSFMVDDNVLVHNTLNTFHLAGVAAKSNMTRGVPRLKELLKATKNPKAVELTIPLRPDLRDKKEEARRVAQDIEFTLLQDLVTTAHIYFDPRDNATLIQEDADWLAYLAAYEMTAPVGQVVVHMDGLAAGGAAEAPEPVEEPKRSPWILRFELDRDRMFAKNITMEDIDFILRQKFNADLTTIYTDYNAPRLVFRARLTVEGNPIDDLNSLKTLQNKVLSATAIRGIPGLRTVNYTKVSDVVELRDGKYSTFDQYVLISDGSNFQDVLIHPDVDATRVYSNNVHDVFANLGVGAPRATLLKEITTLFAESGSSVNYRHVSILVDKMCHRGGLMSIDRYGIQKNDIGPFAKMSFEQTEDISLRAAIFGERDPVLGVSAKVMLGAPIRAGTAFSELLFDEAAAVKLAETTPEQLPASASVPSLYTDEELDDAVFGIAERGVCGTALDALESGLGLPATHLAGVEEEVPDVDIAIVE